MEINTAVCEQQVWENRDIQLFFQEGRKVILDIIDAYIPDKKGTCIEIGCVPGAYLGYMAKKGYEISGVDWDKRVNFMEHHARKKGYKTGSFYEQDVLKFYPKEKFDVVCSFGFIEHFSNWQQMLVGIVHWQRMKDM